MSTPPTNGTKRIDQLDGLRGLAIMLVILNHLHLAPLYALLPKFLQPFLSSLLNSGKVGVSILFLLSGFLISTIYPTVRSKSAFWQKRYTRIFPSFIAMCIALSIIEYFGKSFTPIASIAVVLGVSIIGGLLWHKIVRANNRVAIGKFLFFSFVLFQILAVGGYLFVLSRVPPSVFYLVWPTWAHEVVYFIMNSSLALPFGNYVPLLNGAYWTIPTEVLFYLLYPILILPVVKHIFEKRSKILDLLFLGFSIPFFYGLSILFKSILGFQVMQIYTVIYFVFGVAIGFVYQSPWIISLQRTVNRLPSIILIVTCLALATGLPYVRTFFQWGENIDIVYWTLPLSLLLLITLAPRNKWIVTLQIPLLRTIGRLSYALYLTHMFVIELFFKSVEPTTIGGMIMQITLISGVIVLVTVVLNHFLEEPYFTYKIVPQEKMKQPSMYLQTTRSLRPLWISVAAFLFLIWFAYRMPVTLASDVVNHVDHSVPSFSAITTNPVILHFTGAQPNLGMIFLNLKVLSGSDLKKFHITNGGDTLQYMVADIKDQNGKLLTSNKYTLYQIYDSPFFTVGLPVQPNSLGQKFTISLHASSSNAFQILGLVNSGIPVRSVYFYDKRELTRHPLKGFTLLWNKLIQPFTEEASLSVATLCGPLLMTVVLGLAFIKQKS